MSNFYDPYSSYPSSSKDTSGADHDFDFDHLLNLPPFSPPSSAESPLVSSPENSQSRHFSPEYDLHSISGGEERTSPQEAALSWEGILRGPVWPETNGEFSNPSTSSTTSFSPQTPLNHHLPSPSPHAAAPPPPPPSTLPSFFFPSAAPSPAPTPASAPQPSSALLDALMTYNARYGTILPPSNTDPSTSSSIPAETAASAHGDDEHDDEEEEEAHYSAGGGGAGGDHEEDEDEMAYRDMFGQSYQANEAASMEAGPSGTSYLGVGGSSVGPRRTMGGQVMSSVVVEEGEERMEGDEWRPTPEEYKKLSSKEKRQLRNKISARNFRVRRKNQISTLESRLNDRERIIGAVRDELGSARMENAELRREIQALKNAVFGSTQTPTFNSNTISPAQLEAPSSSSARPSSPLPKVNRSKDVSTSSSKGFWAGQNSSPFGNGPFNTSVHAFTTPDLIFPSSASLAGKQQPNLNPLFNNSGGGGAFFSPPNYKPSLPTATSQEGTFDEFVQSTPYTLRHATVEAYRNQLWTRLAREAAFAKSNANTTSTNGADALASGLRPKFYTSPSTTTSTNSFLNGPKPLSSSSFSSPSSHHSPSMSIPSPPSPSSISPPSDDTSHLAFLAHVVTQSITSRLSAAFVEAFTTPSPSFTSLGSGSNKSNVAQQRSLDAEKIASVLSGRSVVQIVPVNASPSSSSPAPAPTPSSSSTTESALERALAGLSLSSSSSSTPSPTANATTASTSCSVVGGGLKNLLGCVGGGRACHSGRPSSE